MSTPEERLSFGPVPSRRLGRSIGIRAIPAKHCTYSCVYCQVGRTNPLRIDRTSFFRPERIVDDVRRRVEEAAALSKPVDALTFVSEGEPTLDRNLGAEIDRLRPLDIRIAVITNGSLLWMEEVREALAGADWVSVKVDAVREAPWRAVQRPHGALRLPVVLEGMLAFAEAFGGVLATETMLVKGLNDGEEALSETASFVERLHPASAWIAVPTRPPAESSVEAPPAHVLERYARMLEGKVGEVGFLAFYEGDDFEALEDVEREILSTASVHPMREEALSSLLEEHRAPKDLLRRLVARGDLQRREYDGHVFYLRRASAPGREGKP